MVKKDSLVYLLVGQESQFCDQLITEIKEEFLPKAFRDFNLDRLYAKGLRLEDIQEKILCLPFKSKKRILIIRNAQQLSPGAKKFLMDYVRGPQPHIILILEIEKRDPRDEFVNSVLKYAKSFVKEEPRLDAFTLAYQIDSRKPALALKVLHQLLEKGERPERILGGLRYSWENRVPNPLETRKRLKALLACDIDIKTGRLKADFALEKLVVYLCCFQKA